MEGESICLSIYLTTNLKKRKKRRVLVLSPLFSEHKCGRKALIFRLSFYHLFSSLYRVQTQFERTSRVLFFFYWVGHISNLASKIILIYLPESSNARGFTCVGLTRKEMKVQFYLMSRD